MLTLGLDQNANGSSYAPVAANRKRTHVHPFVVPPESFRARWQGNYQIVQLLFLFPEILVSLCSSNCVDMHMYGRATTTGPCMLPGPQKC